MAASADRSPRRHNPQVAASAASTQVAVSAAIAVDDFQHEYDKHDIQHEYDEANMQDMTLQQRGDVVQTRRTSKLGKAYQNWRRSQLKFLADMKRKKVFFVAWVRWRWSRGIMCLKDLLWTEDDMDHFLHTVSSFETHKRRWRQELEMREDPNHQLHDRPMPMIIPPSYVRLFQIVLSQTHSAKFRQHFGIADIDGTLYAPFQMLVESDMVAASAASVAESTALVTKFHVNLFEMDTRLAIDSKTSFLDHERAHDLVSQVKRYRGTKLWMFVMKRVKQMATMKFGHTKSPSPFMLRLGYEQIMGAAFKKRWQHQDHEPRPMLEKEPRHKRRQAQNHEEGPVSGETPDAKRQRIDLTPRHLVKKRKLVVLKKRKQVEPRGWQLAQKGNESEEDAPQKKRKKEDQQDQPMPLSQNPRSDLFTLS